MAIDFGEGVDGSLVKGNLRAGRGVEKLRKELLKESEGRMRAWSFNGDLKERSSFMAL